MHPSQRRVHGIGTAAVLASVLLGACSDATTGPVEDRLAFGAQDLVLVSGEGTLTLRNEGGRALGPIDLSAAAVTDVDGNGISGAELRLEPASIPTLASGATGVVTVRIGGSAPLPPGTFRATVDAIVDGRSFATVRVEWEIADGGGEGIAELRIDDLPDRLRAGDAIPVVLTTLASNGTPVTDVAPTWTVRPAGAGVVTDGHLVGYGPGELEMIARIGGLADTVRTTIEDRGVSGSFSALQGGAPLNRFTSDTWIHGDWAYTGTWGQRTSGQGPVYQGNRLNVWSVAGALPELRGFVDVDARTVNDVKVRDDGTLAVLTHEGSNDGRNGITLLDLSVPGEPRVVGRYTDGLESGVHNVWIDGDVLYVVRDGPFGLQILDVSDPARPVPLAQWYAGDSFLHDVYVRDGLAFLSHWDAGLIILDVGNGILGGSPSNPRHVSTIRELGGETHNAWYWPERGLVFVGEEDFVTPGRMRVVDVSDLRHPRVVADYELGTSVTPHNFWLDEEEETLFLAWYESGLVALDVSGELRGELDRQGRELAVRDSGRQWVWAPQLHDGRIYLSTMEGGLFVAEWTRN